ncbi:hypothetical protein, partial [Butyricicoccus sp.]|uniref:hypothetical protein n=1 Tax=Butyricicoccus sp. TaxID=2049021 RepID=UPI00373585B8
MIDIVPGWEYTDLEDRMEAIIHGNMANPPGEATPGGFLSLHGATSRGLSPGKILVKPFADAMYNYTSHDRCENGSYGIHDNTPFPDTRYRGGDAYR